MMNFNVGGIVSAIEKKADVLGGLWAWYSSWKIGRPDLKGDPVKFIGVTIDKLSSGQFPDIEKLIWRITKSDYVAPQFKNGLILYILSYFGKDFSGMSRYARIGEKLGKGMIIGSVLTAATMGNSPPVDNEAFRRDTIAGYLGEHRGMQSMRPSGINPFAR